MFVIQRDVPSRRQAQKVRDRANARRADDTRGEFQMQRALARPRSGTQAHGKVESQLRYWTQQLHDLSGRNRLLYYRETRSSSAIIESPSASDLVRLLVENRGILRVPLPSVADLARQQDSAEGNSEAEELAEVVQGEVAPDESSERTSYENPPRASRPRDRAQDSDGGSHRATARPVKATRQPAKAHGMELQTDHSVVRLNEVMYNLHYAARTVQEEQGFNILYITLGMLHWRDVNSHVISHAPLVLLPVQVERQHPGLPYRVRPAEDDIVVNPVLQIKLQRDFGFELPDVSNDLTKTALVQFLDEAADRVSELEGWSVAETVTLGPFNFLTQLLIKDFEKYGALYEKHPLVRWVSGLEVPDSHPAEQIPEAAELDELVDPAGVFQVLDADSSQQEAIEAAKRGLSFVLQGPPGTGKSQTIANLIAESVMAGKRVLFVSQKMAALEVVHNRLRRKGLADFCLEVHSHKMDKRRVINDLMTSLSDSPLRVPNPELESKKDEIRAIRDELNAYVRQLHEPRLGLGLSLYELYGRLTRYLAEPRLDFSFAGAELLTSAELANTQASIRELSAFEGLIHGYGASRWRGWLGPGSTMEERERIGRELRAGGDAILRLHTGLTEIARRYELPQPETVGQDLEYMQVLDCFRAELFSPKLRGAIRRYKVNDLPGGKAFSLQYGEDSRKMAGVYRSRQQATAKEIAEALTIVNKILAKAHNASGPRQMNFPDDTAAYFEMEKARTQFREACEALKGMFGDVDVPALLTRSSDYGADEVAQWFFDQGERIEDLAEWTQFREVRALAVGKGLGDFVERALAETIPPAKWEGVFCQRFYRLCVEHVLRDRPLLRRFRGTTHSDLVSRFRELDLQTIDMSAGRIRTELTHRKPQGSWMKSESAETSVLRREFNKKRGLKPLRKLFAEIPSLVQTLKPCLMMSPLTVCQLLDPRIHQFDLAVFDEASQIPPEYAVSAFLRAKQVIVAGDSQQLPPMNFFQTLEDDEATDEDGAGETQFESILTLCDSRGFPRKMLNWHYRSRDESLIAYSNFHFYENRLFTFPNASRQSTTTGLKFVPVPEGVYHAGEAARNNPVEARRVADLVFQHLSQSPELSLGVVAFNVPQRRAIEREINRLRMLNRNLERLFRYDLQEPLFVKNLENVQGDERDVIVLSVGYGRDEAGKTALNFGPLNRDGGSRRLNVAVTRARRLLYLVSSMQPEDIDLVRATSAGARLLRSYLATARDGVRALYPETAEVEESQSHSAFVESVYEELSKRGLQLSRSVGVSQYRVELAVKDPRDDSRFILGLESDGDMYRSGMTARDRDRLREQVLEGLGWRMHRIWSRDWVEDREGEIDKILQELEGKHPAKGRILEVESSPNPKGQQSFGTDTKALAAPRERLLPARAVYFSPPELPRPRGAGLKAILASPLSEIIDALQRLANEEGPIASATAKSAILRAWQVRRGAKVEGRLELAIKKGAEQGAYMLNGNFLWPSGRRVAPLRVHTAGKPVRKISEIAPEEIEEAVHECVSGSVTIRRDDLGREVARLFGLRMTTDNAASIDQVILDMLGREVLRETAGKVSLGRTEQTGA